MTDPAHPFRLAIAGAIVWILWVAAVHPAWTACLLVLGLLVVVPLGLALVDRPEAGPAGPALATLRRTSPVAAACAALAFTVDPGAIAAALTVPWLAVGLAAAMIGLARLGSRTAPHPAFSTDVSLVFLAVGAGWLTVSRAGLRPMGFSDTIVQLTAVHFHYAGVALPIVAGIAAARARASALVPALVVVGVPFTAVGITAGGATEWVAATTMAVGGLATAALLLRLATRTPRTLGAGLLVVAAGSIGAGMALALAWSWSIRFGWSHLDIATMARWHGTLNALGFAFVGLIGLHVASPTERHQGDATAVHLRPVRPATRAAIATRAERDAPTSPAALLADRTIAGYRHDVWRTELPHGFEAGRTALASWAGHHQAHLTFAAPLPPVRAGATVAFSIPLGPLAVTAACRIVEVVDEPDRFGFTYATLPHHPEVGEESFLVERHADGRTTFTVTAGWRPHMLLARVAPPLTRRVQRRTIARYLAGVAAATAHRPTSEAHR